MVGAYTSFEVEAERRREVLAESMRDIRRARLTRDGAGHENRRGESPDGRSLARLVASLHSQAGQHA